LRTVPAPEWMESLPWPKIGAGLGSAVLVLVTGVWGKEQLNEARAPSEVQQEHVVRHYNWQTACPVIAEAPQEGTWVRKCPDDDCRIFLDVRGGLQRMFFVVAPNQVPTAPMILGVVSRVFDFPGQPVYAQGNCLADHGQPDGDPPLWFGADLGNGWVEQFVGWRDGCRMKRQYHRPTTSATAWQWVACVH
jgi:hypothetical protein